MPKKCKLPKGRARGTCSRLVKPLVPPGLKNWKAKKNCTRWANLRQDFSDDSASKGIITETTLNELITEQSTHGTPDYIYTDGV